MRSQAEETEVFADITLNLRGLEDTEVKISLFFDGIENKSFFVGEVGKNKAVTTHFSAHQTIGNGIHKVDIVLSENCGILRFSAYVWGQNIAEVQPEPTYAKDYEYMISDGSATIPE